MMFKSSYSHLSGRSQREEEAKDHSLEQRADLELAFPRAVITLSEFTYLDPTPCGSVEEPEEKANLPASAACH